MKKTLLLITLAIIFITVIPASAETDTANAASHIAVLSCDIDPGVLMDGDTGTLRITVKNTGTDSVTIRRATILTKDLVLKNDQAYATADSLGPDVTKEFTFTLEAKEDGIFYPRLYLDFSAGGSLSYPVMVKVESTPPELSVLDKPDVFQKDVSDKVRLVIGNPRENTLNGIIVRPVSDNASFKQTSVFVGELKSNGYSEIAFDVTPINEGEIRFVAEYRNGVNHHETETAIPVIFGEYKKSANPVVNNLELTSSGKGYMVSGDVTNAGLENAKSIVITTGSPAVPADPNRLYVIGELEPDDFSSFEVDFTATDAKTIPLLIQFKDEDGNDYTKPIDIKIREGPKAAEGVAQSEDKSEGMPVAAIILVIAAIAVAGGAIYNSWKKN